MTKYTVHYINEHGEESWTTLPVILAKRKGRKARVIRMMERIFGPKRCQRVIEIAVARA